MPEDFPLSQQLKSAIEMAKFAELSARLFKGGLPIFTSAREITINKPQQGEIWLEDVSGTRRICAYISGTKYSVNIT